MYMYVNLSSAVNSYNASCLHTWRGAAYLPAYWCIGGQGWIVQINFSLKLQFSLKFGFKLTLNYI